MHVSCLTATVPTSYSDKDSALSTFYLLQSIYSEASIAVNKTCRESELNNISIKFLTPIYRNIMCTLFSPAEIVKILFNSHSPGKVEKGTRFIHRIKSIIGGNGRIEIQLLAYYATLTYYFMSVRVMQAPLSRAFGRGALAPDMIFWRMFRYGPRPPLPTTFAITSLISFRDDKSWPTR